MNNGEIKQLVDKGRALKVKMDTIEAELNGIKEILRKEAAKRKQDNFLGEKHFARISPDTTTNCDPQKLHDTFKDLERPKEFYDCVKVQVTSAKSLLGETVFGSIATVESIPYKKITFLDSIPKKYLEAK